MLPRLKLQAAANPFAFFCHSAKPMALMTAESRFCFASRMKQKRIYVDKTCVIMPNKSYGD